MSSVVINDCLRLTTLVIHEVVVFFREGVQQVRQDRVWNKRAARGASGRRDFLTYVHMLVVSTVKKSPAASGTVAFGTLILPAAAGKRRKRENAVFGTGKFEHLAVIDDLRVPTVGGAEKVFFFPLASTLA